MISEELPEIVSDTFMSDSISPEMKAKLEEKGVEVMIEGEVPSI